MTRSRGIIADRIAQRRKCVNPVAAQTENSSTEGRMRGGRGAVNTPTTDRTNQEFSQ